MMSLEGQLADYGQLQEELFGPINVDEIAGPTVPRSTVDVGTRPMRPKLGRGLAWAAAAFAVVLTLGGLYLAFSGADGQVVDQTTVPTPTTILAPMPVEGTWVTTDADGSTPTMTVQVSGEGVVEITVLDDLASVCSGAPSTMIGVGRLEGATMLVIPAPVLTCDDGSQPEALSDSSLEEILEDLTLAYDPETDTLTDNLGSTWWREGAPMLVEGMWPQSSLEEVREAQERADAGDPDYIWQLDQTLAANGKPWGAEIVARFLEEELGWEQFVGDWDGSGYAYAEEGGVYEEVVLIRCAPDQTNPLSDLYVDMPPEIRECAPTIDDLRYETVQFRLTQPGVKGPSGIWVVDRWETLQPAPQGSLWGLLYPDFAFRQVEQVAPPSDVEVTAFMEAFLRARVDGEGAEQYLLSEPEESPFLDSEVPILYATTSGSRYQRFEIEKMEGPVWPSGWSKLKVRLFAEGGTVVEQLFRVVRQENGQLGLVFGYEYEDLPTTQNGQSVPVPYSLLDGEVTFAAAPPWTYGNLARDYDAKVMRFSGAERGEGFVIAADPLPDGTGCETGPVAANAEELAGTIMANPDVETTEPVPVSIGGLHGLQMDVAVAANGEHCYWIWFNEGLPAADPGWRLRLYLLDYPGESAQVLTIAVLTPWASFEEVIEEATPIVESLQINPR
jgi:hypothetical protein